jgi:glutathionylspermidine synthase
LAQLVMAFFPVSEADVQRVTCLERPDWRQQAEQTGFDFHTINGEPYWDESAYYAFTLEEIERDIEAPTGELDQMCRDLVARAVSDERILRSLSIPQAYWDLVAASWRRNDKSLYGRFDFCYGGDGPAKLLEYNADTPTAVFETAVFQWHSLEQAIDRQVIPASSDQFNSLHECLIEGWAAIGKGSRLHLAGALDNAEDAGTLRYLEDTARQAGLLTTILDIESIGYGAGGRFVDLDDDAMTLIFKLYPWEWMFREPFGVHLPGASARFVEPPWKAILSNKGILPLLWAMFPRHPNLLPAYFDDDPKANELGSSFVSKPIFSREGANVEIVRDGQIEDKGSGQYGAEGHVRQAVSLLPRFGDSYAVVGSWIAAGRPCGLSVREDASPITKNTSRFLPHAMVA